MDFYEEIKNLSEKDLEILIERKIEDLEKESKKENQTDTIGYTLDYNPKDYHLSEKDIDSFMKDRRN